ncbi:hypothetical protein PybrP1_002420 [[Pythium] brassicae (nom. inval.)]|nr:hypothetical protein PybrP1_002420 [[Pythium] brassicae (nom. inval.)]
MADTPYTSRKTSRVDALRDSLPSSWRAEHMPPHLRHAESDSLKNRRAAQTPLVLAGMSYGTLVGLHTALDGAHTFAAVVLVAPAVSVEWTTTLRVQRVFAKPLSALLPKARIVPGVNRAWLCRDPAFVADFAQDPLNVAGDVTSRMGEQSLGAMLALKKDPRLEQPDSAFCALPILILMGSSDKITSLPLAKEFYGRIANRDKELKVFDGLYHALFDDPEKDDVFDHLVAWLHARFPAGGDGGGDRAAPEEAPAAGPEAGGGDDGSRRSSSSGGDTGGDRETVEVVTATVTTEDGAVYTTTVEVAVDAAQDAAAAAADNADAQRKAQSAASSEQQ